MESVDLGKAKKELATLVARAAKGERILITRQGKLLAILARPPRELKGKITRIVKEMLEFRDRRGPVLGRGLTIRKLIDEGRRF